MQVIHFSRTLEGCAGATLLPRQRGAVHAQRRRRRTAGPRPRQPPAHRRRAADAAGGVIRTDVRHHHDRRDRPRQQRAVHRRSEERRFEILEDGVKQEVVSFLLTHGGRVYNASAPPPAPHDGRHHPAAEQADQRRRRPHLPDLRRRPAPGLPATPAASGISSRKSRRSWCTKATCSASSRRGPSSLAIDLTYDRKRLDEAIDKISGAGLKPSGHPRRAAWRGRSTRSALPRARRLRHGVRHHEEPRAGAQPPQGVHLRQQRLRLQSVLRNAQEERPGAMAGDEPERRAATTAAATATRATRTRSCGRATSSALPISPPSSAS